jgi:hypothetical protein
MTIETKNNPPFEIGLVMAGAVSAGAYTAGVMDYLIETLEAWEETKNAERKKLKNDPNYQPSIPLHDIEIKVMTGASAGGMTTAIAAVELLRRAQHPEKVKEKNYRSLMYQAWVEKIDITRLLQTHDLAQSDSIKSLLDATAIDEIANSVIDVEKMPPWKSIPYIAPDLKLYLTLSNLRGLPYSFKLQGETGFPYGMTDHSDYQFVEIKDWKSEPERKAAWTKLRNAAIATGAFPVGLSSRLIKRDTNEYKTRISKDGRDISGLLKLDTAENEPYYFVAVDGGTLNNEPIELARSVWEKYTEKEKQGMTSFQAYQNTKADREIGVTESKKSKKDYALILIDPFPDLSDMGKNATDEDTDLLNIIGPIVGALRAQSLFKMEELLRAGDGDGSYLVAPIRYDATGTKAKNAIACGFMAGFGGFLAQEFRAHDYQLGRRNAQRFLSTYFRITEQEAKDRGWAIAENYVFEQSIKEVLREEKKDDDGNLINIQLEQTKQVRFYPIIPVLKDSAVAYEQGAQNPWPIYSRKRKLDLEKNLAIRVRALSNTFLPLGWLHSKWVMMAIALSIVLIMAGEFVKAGGRLPWAAQGFSNNYILLLQAILLIVIAGLVVLKIARGWIDKTLIKKTKDIFISQVKQWGIEIEK